jgi:hypothetical protein
MQLQVFMAAFKLQQQQSQLIFVHVIVRVFQHEHRAICDQSAYVKL